MKRNVVLTFAFLLLSETCMVPKGNDRFKDEHVKPIVHANSGVVVVAHRGASAYGPENSLAAYNQAVKMHADYIEIDVQMTKDDHLIVMHDASLARTTNAKEMYPQRAPWLIKDFTLKEIRELDAGTWFNTANQNKARQEYTQEHVPTLKEVIRFAKQKKIGLYIETKTPNIYPKMEEALIKILRNNGLLHKSNLMIGSLSEASLRKLKKLAPSIKVVQLYSREMLEGKDVKKEFKRISRYAAGVGPRKDLVVPKLVKIAHQNGLLVHTWTVNKKDDMVSLLSLGVDGEITNKPDRFAHLRDKRLDKRRAAK